MKTLPVASFLGINNRLPDFALRVATSQMNGQYLRTADNVEVNNAGRLVRRRAAKLLVPMALPHSLHEDRLLARGSALYAVTLPAYTEVLLKVLTNDSPMSYVTSGADTYYSNGVDTGRVTGGAVFPLGLPTPGTPATAVVAGALLKGWYQLSVSYCNTATGEEGGISPSSNTEITATGALSVTLPDAVAGATHINIYLSGANGAIPLWLAQVPVGTATYACTALGTGREAPQRYEAPLPAGTLFMSNGRLCSFAGSVVYVGLPHRPGYYLPAEGFIPFKDAVAVAIENQGGTYIATTKDTYWFPGDLGDTQGQLTSPLPYGAVPGTAFRFPFNTNVGWFGTMGVVFADTQGQVDAVMLENIDLTPPTSGTSTVFSDKGHVRVMSCGWCVNLENKAATNYSGWDFTSASDSYATGSDGIYQIGAVAPVLWSFGFGKLNFGSEELKHLPTVYAGVACETELELTVGYTDERGNEQSYTYPTRGCSELLKQQRFDTGRGIRASWFDLSVSNSTGSDFTLASMSFAPAQSTRRI